MIHDAMIWGTMLEAVFFHTPIITLGLSLVNHLLVVMSRMDKIKFVGNGHQAFTNSRPKCPLPVDK